MSLLERTTPALLTLNEEANIARALESLDFADDIVVVDSGSTDRTVDIAKSFRGVRVCERGFDDFGRQWSFAFHETGIRTPFVLALDADMAVSPDLRSELAALPDDVPWGGAFLPFDYRIRGRSVGRSLLPPQLRLVKRDLARTGQRGHAHVIECDGETVVLRGTLMHDDRKPLETFLRAQCNYSAQEWERLKQEPPRRLVERVRRSGGLAGTLALCAYSAMRIGLWSSSPQKRRYWIERALFELLLAYRREESALERKGSP